MKDFFDYVKKDEDGNDCGYDYDKIVSDAWKQLNYPGKLETVWLFTGEQIGKEVRK